jgi:transposase
MLPKFKVRKDDYLRGIYSGKSERPKSLKILTVDGFGRSLSYLLRYEIWIDNFRKSQKALRRAQRKVSRKKKGSANRKKAINKLGRKHLKVSRQRKDFAIKTELCVVK